MKSIALVRTPLHLFSGNTYFTLRWQTWFSWVTKVLIHPHRWKGEVLLSCLLGKKWGQFWQASAFQLNKLWNMNMHRIPVCRDIFVLETRVVTDSFQFRSGNLWTPINIGTILIGPFDNSSLLPERMRHTVVLWVLKGWFFFLISVPVVVGWEEINQSRSLTCFCVLHLCEGKDSQVKTMN